MPTTPPVDVPNRIDWCEICGEHCTVWCPGCAACDCAEGCDPGCPEQQRGPRES